MTASSHVCLGESVDGTLAVSSQLVMLPPQAESRHLSCFFIFGTAVLFLWSAEVMEGLGIITNPAPERKKKSSLAGLCANISEKQLSSLRCSSNIHHRPSVIPVAGKWVTAEQKQQIPPKQPRYCPTLLLYSFTFWTAQVSVSTDTTAFVCVCVEGVGALSNRSVFQRTNKIPALTFSTVLCLQVSRK